MMRQLNAWATDHCIGTRPVTDTGQLLEHNDHLISHEPKRIKYLP